MPRLLVNFFYAQPVGHAIEALYYANGYGVANPGFEIHVAMNAAAPAEISSFCPWLSGAYAINHPFLEPASDDRALDGVPREWDWIVDDGRRHQSIQVELFPGMAGYYAASDRVLRASEGRRPIGYPPPAYAAHRQLRLELPMQARRVTAGAMANAHPLIAVMPAGSSEPTLYPSLRSWTVILDALADALPDARFVFVGRHTRDERTRTSFSREDLDVLLARPRNPIDAFDVSLAQQLALVEQSALFLSPHTGFGMAALAVGTPWLALSGGRWFEYFFNHVPFRSIVPDVERYPAFTQFEAPEVEGERTPSMSDERIDDDLDRIVTAARELVAGELTYEDALRDYFRDLLAAHGGDASLIWSIDGVHAAYLPRRH